MMGDNSEKFFFVPAKLGPGAAVLDAGNAVIGTLRSLKKAIDLPTF